jgi:predicted nucleic acid-binding protein
VILADTSVWVEYLRSGNPRMQIRLASGQILMHPFIVAELALGSLPNRSKMLVKLDAFLEVKVAQLSEVRQMIEAHSLYSKGIGLTDAHLLASCLLTPGTRLWTRDNALANAARALGIHADLP